MTYEGECNLCVSFLSAQGQNSAFQTGGSKLFSNTIHADIVFYETITRVSSIIHLAYFDVQRMNFVNFGAAGE